MNPPFIRVFEILSVPQLFVESQNQLHVFGSHSSKSSLNDSQNFIYT